MVLLTRSGLDFDVLPQTLLNKDAKGPLHVLYIFWINFNNE